MDKTGENLNSVCSWKYLQTKSDKISFKIKAKKLNIDLVLILRGMTISGQAFTIPGLYVIVNNNIKILFKDYFKELIQK